MVVFRNFANASVKELRKLTGLIHTFPKTISEYNHTLIKTTIPMDNFCHY